MPKAVVDETGQAIKLLEYDSFGNLISDSNPDFYLPVGFADGLADNSTGLVRFGFRDYDPVSGRWAAKDPLLFAGAQANLFTYCGDNPVNLVDRWGLSAKEAPCQSDEVSNVKVRITKDRYLNKKQNNTNNGAVFWIPVKTPILITSGITFCPSTGQVGVWIGGGFCGGYAMGWSQNQSKEGFYTYGECCVIGGLQVSYGPILNDPEVGGTFEVGLSTGIAAYYYLPDWLDLY